MTELEQALGYMTGHYEWLKKDGRMHEEYMRGLNHAMLMLEQLRDCDSVCVKCGLKWWPSIKNACECGGFCTWGKKLGGHPTSWVANEQGALRPRMPGEEIDPETGLLRD